MTGGAWEGGGMEYAGCDSFSKECRIAGSTPAFPIFYRMAVCRFSQAQPQKTLSVEIRLHRDCDSRWVADSVPEVINGW